MDEKRRMKEAGLNDYHYKDIHQHTHVSMFLSS